MEFPTSSAGQEVLVRLSSGDTLRGQVVRQDETTITLRHPVLGELVVPRAGITQVELAPPPGAPPAPPGTPPLPVPLPPGPSEAADQSAATLAPRAPDDAASSAPPAAPAAPGAPASPDAGASGVPTPPASPPAPPSPWKGVIAAAVNYTNNNDTTIDARLAGGLKYTVPDVETLDLNAEYFFKTLNSNTTDNNLLTNAVYDRFITGTDWLWFAKAQYQYSEFEAWEHRISGYGGLGYRFYSAPPVDLLAKLGAGGTYEFGPPSQGIPEAYGEFQFAWLINELQRLEMSGNIAPDLSDVGEFRVISRAEWKLKVDPELDLSLTIGARWQYESKVPAGDVHNDLRVYAGLQLGF